MGKSSPKPPQAPDPYKTAAAQGAWNSFTAQQQQQMNMIGQNTPWGTLEYSQNGTTTMRDPTGKLITIPSYTANINLSPSQQAIFDQSQQAQSSLAGLAADQAAKMREYLDTPFEFDNQDAANWAYDLGAQRLSPRFEQQRDAMRTQLINQGIRPGTEAWDREMSRMDQGENDAYNQLMLQGRGQAFNEAFATRSQPINEITALMSGSQIQSPNSTFAASPQTSVGGVDFAGLVGQNYAAQMAGYNSQVAQQQNAMGGLFGLGSNLLGAAGMAGGFGTLFSDRRLKIDIERVGTMDNGLPVYLYRMKSGGPYQIGVMAQDVEEVMPEAVVDDPSGFKKVSYELAARAV